MIIPNTIRHKGGIIFPIRPNTTLVVVRPVIDYMVRSQSQYTGCKIMEVNLTEVSPLMKYYLLQQISIEVYSPDI